MAKKKKASKTSESQAASRAKYPRHSLDKALRIPSAILEQNAGKECTEKEAAGFLGLGSASGPFSLEISSGLKFGLLDRPTLVRSQLRNLLRKFFALRIPQMK